MFSDGLYYDAALTGLSCPSMQLKAKKTISGLRLKNFPKPGKVGVTDSYSVKGYITLH